MDNFSNLVASCGVGSLLVPIQLLCIDHNVAYLTFRVASVDAC